jgi:hypothetical protein
MTFSNDQLKIEIIENDIIFVTKIGSQNSSTINIFRKEIGLIAKKLRASNKQVLILIDSTNEGQTTAGGWKALDKAGKDMDYDKSATYGLTAETKKTRQKILHDIGRKQKIADFSTKAQALKWLLK